VVAGAGDDETIHGVAPMDRLGGGATNYLPSREFLRAAEAALTKR
jgi:hypothetical protein